MGIENPLMLSDGRKLAWAEYGDPAGDPVLYFHGSPACRLEPLLIGDETWRRFGLRVIAPDRPGIGASDFQPRRTFSDWPADVTALADALERFAVLGNSGGGPYVAVCAAKIPARLRAAVIVSGGWRMDWPESKDHLPFVNRLFMKLARDAPPLLRLMLHMMGRSGSNDRNHELAQLQSRVPPADFAAFAAPGRIEAFGQMMRECLRQGTKGPAWDLRLYVRDFGFALEEIQTPITWFHGEKDVNAPLPLVRRAVSQMPTVRLVTFENDSHLSTLTNNVEELATALRTPLP